MADLKSKNAVSAQDVAAAEKAAARAARLARIKYNTEAAALHTKRAEQAGQRAEQAGQRAEQAGQRAEQAGREAEQAGKEAAELFALAAKVRQQELAAAEKAAERRLQQNAPGYAAALGIRHSTSTSSSGSDNSHSNSGDSGTPPRVKAIAPKKTETERCC